MHIMTTKTREMTEHEKMVLAAVEEAGGEEYTETLYDLVFEVAPGDEENPYEHARAAVGGLENLGYLDFDENTNAVMGKNVLTEKGREALGR